MVYHSHTLGLVYVEVSTGTAVSERVSERVSEWVSQPVAQPMSHCYSYQVP